MKRLILLVPFLVASCANPINLRTANEYFRGGQSNAAQGNWFKARMSFGRAWTNADLGHANDGIKAVYAYEYGRTSGVICDWAESEKGLLKALELDAKINGPVHMSLVELARMYHAKGDLQNSEKYFGQAKQSLDKIQADTRDSIGYANILKEYAEILTRLGKTEDAKLLKRREEEIRSVFKDRASSHDQTPYGRHCDQNPTYVDTRRSN